MKLCYTFYVVVVCSRVVPNVWEQILLETSTLQKRSYLTSL